MMIKNEIDDEDEWGCEVNDGDEWRGKVRLVKIKTKVI